MAIKIPKRIQWHPKPPNYTPQWFAHPVSPWEQDPIVELEQKYKISDPCNEGDLIWAFAHLLADILVGHKYPDYFNNMIREIRRGQHYDTAGR